MRAAFRSLALQSHLFKTSFFLKRQYRMSVFQVCFIHSGIIHLQQPTNTEICTK